MLLFHFLTLTSFLFFYYWFSMFSHNDSAQNTAIQLWFLILWESRHVLAASQPFCLTSCWCFSDLVIIITVIEPRLIEIVSQGTILCQVHESCKETVKSHKCSYCRWTLYTPVILFPADWMLCYLRSSQNRYFLMGAFCEILHLPSN